MVKIVSVSPPMFTSKNVQKSSINITTLDQRNLASMKNVRLGLISKNEKTKGHEGLNEWDTLIYTQTATQLPEGYRLDSF